MIWNREAETLRPGARAALQLERLRQSVAWAGERVPFHQARLGRARPDRLAQLAELPSALASVVTDRGILGVRRGGAGDGG